jgi:hypothetical protein
MQDRGARVLAKRPLLPARPAPVPKAYTETPSTKDEIALGRIIPSHPPGEFAVSFVYVCAHSKFLVKEFSSSAIPHPFLDPAVVERIQDAGRMQTIAAGPVTLTCDIIMSHAELISIPVLITWSLSSFLWNVGSTLGDMILTFLLCRTTDISALLIDNYPKCLSASLHSISPWKRMSQSMASSQPATVRHFSYCTAFHKACRSGTE